MAGFLVLHGWRNRQPPDHWHHLLVDALRSAGHVVAYPQLPDPDKPDLDAWLAAFAAELPALPRDGERVVVAHSLGCLLWWQAAARGFVDPPVDRFLLVAPPSPEVTRDHRRSQGSTCRPGSRPSRSPRPAGRSPGWSAATATSTRLAAPTLRTPRASGSMSTD